MSVIKMYGIPNCDTVKKAVNWFKSEQVTFEFHDYKKEGITAAKVKQWCRLKGWEAIFNTRSSTWKDLAKDGSKTVANQADAIAIMVEHNSIIKRPVLEIKDDLIVGYDETTYIQKLK